MERKTTQPTTAQIGNSQLQCKKHLGQQITNICIGGCFTMLCKVCAEEHMQSDTGGDGCRLANINYAIAESKEKGDKLRELYEQGLKTYQ